MFPSNSLISGPEIAMEVVQFSLFSRLTSAGVGGEQEIEISPTTQRYQPLVNIYVREIQNIHVTQNSIQGSHKKS